MAVTSKAFMAQRSKQPEKSAAVAKERLLWCVADVKRITGRPIRVQDVTAIAMAALRPINWDRLMGRKA